MKEIQGYNNMIKHMIIMCIWKSVSAIVSDIEIMTTGHFEAKFLQQCT